VGLRNTLSIFMNIRVENVKRVIK